MSDRTLEILCPECGQGGYLGCTTTLDCATYVTFACDQGHSFDVKIDGDSGMVEILANDEEGGGS